MQNDLYYILCTYLYIKEAAGTNNERLQLSAALRKTIVEFYRQISNNTGNIGLSKILLLLSILKSDFRRMTEYDFQVALTSFNSVMRSDSLATNS